MKLNINTLREIVESIVREHLDKTINEAIEKRMRSLAVSFIAESRLSAQRSPQINQQIRPALPASQPVAKLLKKQVSAPKSVMEQVLLDTQQTTLREQQDAEQAQNELPDEIREASSKYAKLAFAAPLPTRSSVVPKPDAE